MECKFTVRKLTQERKWKNQHRKGIVIRNHQTLTLATQEGRDQEDHGSKPTQGNFSRPYVKHTQYRKGLAE
jgi:hypothetical protein